MNYLVCVDLSNYSLEGFKDLLSHVQFNKSDKVTFVHCFETQYFAGDFYLSYFPAESEIPEIEKSISSLLAEMAKDICASSDATIESKCLVDSDSKQAIVDFINDNQIDCTYLLTRGLHGLEGLFSSSFAEYLVRRAPCELRILRGPSK